MTKLTKHAYKAKLIKLQADLVAVKAKIIIADQSAGKSLPAGIAWNDLYDLEYEIEKEIRNLERAFSQRNYTAQDYIMAELVANNID